MQVASQGASHEAVRAKWLAVADSSLPCQTRQRAARRFSRSSLSCHLVTMVQTRAQGAAKIGRTIDENGVFPERQQVLTDVENQVAQAIKRRRTAGNPSQDQRRKRTLEDTCTSGLAKSPAKRQQVSRQAGPEKLGDAAAQNKPISDTDTDDPIEFWRRKGRWPSRLFEPGLERVLARKRSSSTLSGRKRANSSSSTPSDQKPREEKDAQYRDPRYKTLLATKGSFMNEFDKGIARESKTAYMTLLTAEQTLPTESLFQDELFHPVCARTSKESCGSSRP